MKVFSYGGGVQSTAALVLAIQGQIDYPLFVFCNVGNDSENPATIEYVEQIAKPYALAHHIEFVELARSQTLYAKLTKPGSRSVGIPVRMSNGAPGRRPCTVDYKIKLAARYIKSRGATAANPATVGLGISLDEFQRARNDSGIAWEKLAYPLLDLRLSRADCLQIIEKAGLPTPPKSSCWFCPYHTMRVWQDMRNQQPELFERACKLEALLNERRKELGKDNIWLSGKLRPLAMATTDLTQLTFEEDICESGYCFV